MKAEEQRRLDQLRSYKKPGFSGDVNDQFYVEAMRIENMGFEEGHQLRRCGHSRGDYRDPDYGTPDYKGNEACVGCQRESVLKAVLESRLAKAEAAIDETLRKGTLYAYTDPLKRYRREFPFEPPKVEEQPVQKG